MQLKDAGLDAYNHNLDTSREHYPKVISTRSYDDRLQTIANVCTAHGPTPHLNPAPEPRT